MNYTTEIYIDSDGQELTKKTFSDGTEAWYKDGLRHRLDGPSIIYSNGTEYWYKDGLLHREDGPAVIYSDSSEFYYLEGKEVSRKEYYKKIGKSNQDISITKENGYITIKIKV